MIRKYILLTTLALLSFAPNIHAYDKSYIGETIIVKTEKEDTLPYLARDYNLGYIEILAANQSIDPWMPEEGTAITIPTRHILPNTDNEGIVINLAEMRLYAFPNKEDTPPLTFPLGVGREGLETPTGETYIRYKTQNPTWRPTKRMREEDPELPASIPAAQNNPLGAYAMYLGWPEYLIHGTNRPFGIGRRVSSGCIRMYPEAIETLYQNTPKDTKVTVVDQPIKAAWINGTLYLEAHTTMAQSIELETSGKMTDTELTEDEKTFITDLAGDQTEKLDWDQINDIVKKRTGVPIPIIWETSPKKESPKKKNPPLIRASVNS